MKSDFSRMLIADDEMDARDLISRQSTASVGTEMHFPPSYGSSMEVLHDLYQKLEPQISKSYRPHVKYVPGNDPGPKHLHIASQDSKTRKQKHIKAARIVIGAVAEMQKKRDTAISVKKKFGDIAMRASAQESNDSILKGASQSLPNLTATTDS